MAMPDVMKDTGHRALHPEIKALDRVGVNRATNIFAASMLHRLVRGKTLTNRDECLPLVAHQVGPWVDLFLEHPFDFIAWAPRICARPSSRQLGRGL